MHNSEIIIEESNIVYGSVLGAGLLADIAYPKNRRNMPVIISVHGGRWIRGTRFDDGLNGRPNNGVINLTEWAKKGFFSIRIDYRLVTCTPAPACFQDVACSVRWVHSVSKKYNLDTSNIFLIGQSAGGHMVSLAATAGLNIFPKVGGHKEMSTDFRAAISVSGAYNLISLDWGSGWCPLGEDWNFARSFASPLEHISINNKPLLIFHAIDDHSVLIKQADEFVEKLKKEGSQHTYHRYNEGGHFKISKEVINRTLEFIEINRFTK
jgi:acetyl esterase/lipase